MNFPKLFALFVPLALTLPAQGAPVEWQQSTLQLIQKGGNYARVARVDAAHIACIYEHGGIRLRRSADNGKSWGDEIQVADVEGYNAANPELLILPNGDWLCSFNGRPRAVAPSTFDGQTSAPDADKNALPFTIAVCRSADAGQTWSAPQSVYRAGKSGGVGCWEPRAINARDGSVQLYFANEFPYPATTEQEISRLISRDNGVSWGAPQTVSLRAGHRDGMPVPLVLQNGKTVMAIEDNGLSGTFKPVIIAPQNGAPVGATSQYRWSALQTPLASYVYAGAPYLAQMPDGTTILSAQVGYDGALKNARMAVWVGDSDARNFGDVSFPFYDFNQISGKNGLWNALWPKDAHTVSALSNTSIGGVFGVWCISGRVGQSIEAAPAKVDGANVRDALN